MIAPMPVQQVEREVLKHVFERTTRLTATQVDAPAASAGSAASPDAAEFVSAGQLEAMMHYLLSASSNWRLRSTPQRYPVSEPLAPTTR